MQLNLRDGAGPADVLELWGSDIAAGDLSDLSFAFSTAPAEPGLFQVNLPDDPAVAAARLAASEATVRRSQQVLTAAAGRLERLQATGAEVSFGAGVPCGAGAVLLLAPERELLAQLQGDGAPGGAKVSFSSDTGGTIGSDADAALGSGAAWQQAQHGFESLMNRLRQTFSGVARIETLVAGRLLGRTIVSGSGDLRTEWPAGNTAQDAALHQRAVALALKSRETILKIFAATVQLAVSLAVPGGLLLALPAVLKFIKQMLALQNGQQPL